MNKNEIIKETQQKDSNENSIIKNEVEQVEAQPIETNLANESKVNENRTNVNFDNSKMNQNLFSAPTFGMSFVKNFMKNNVQEKESDFEQQQENNVKNYELNYSLITVDPINNFYYHISKTINDVLDDYLQQKFSSNKANEEEIKLLSKKINDEEQSIIDKEKGLKIAKKRCANGFIFFLLFLIIGFAFFKIYKRNKKIIKEFENFRNEKYKIIRETINKRFSLIFYAVSTIILKDVFKYVFGRYGIKISEKIPVARLIKFLNNPNIIDIHSGISGKYKNTPFFDIIYRTLVWENVTTSRSESYPYTVTVTRYDSNNRPYTATETRYETLTAYHNEMTPFVYRYNSLILLTNFESDFCFYLCRGNCKKEFLENKEFIQKYDIHTPSENKEYLDKQNTSQFFTIKAQEDYVKWFNLNQGEIFNLKKNYNAFVINNANYGVDNLYKMNYTVDDIGFLENNKNVGIEEIKRRVKMYVFRYFEKFTKMLQIPLLSPVINRELYIDDNQYHIGNEITNTNDYDNQEFDDLYIIYRFLENNFFWFNNKKRADKPIWFKFINKSKINDINHYQYMMNSFWSETLIENIAVHGVHVGTHVISVPYRKFYELTESKFLSHIPFKGIHGKSIMTCPTFNNLLNDSHYSNKDFAKIIKENFIWTNDPGWLENYENINSLIKILISFNSLNKEGQMSLVIDEYGAYVLSNVKGLFMNKNIEKILKDILIFFKSHRV